MIKRIKHINLIECSLVSLPQEIKSQWQANFIQTFPSHYNKLPLTHKSDEAFFYKYWKGIPKNLTFEEFKNSN